MLEQASQHWEAKQGPDHPETLHSRTNLALAYRDAGRISEAIALQEETIRLREARIGSDDPDIFRNREGLAEAYERIGDWSKAERLFRVLVAGRRTVAGPDRSLLAEDLAALGRNLLAQSKWPEAEASSRESLAIYEEAFPDHWRRYQAMNQVGGV